MSWKGVEGKWGKYVWWRRQVCWLGELWHGGPCVAPMTIGWVGSDGDIGGRSPRVVPRPAKDRRESDKDGKE